MNSSLQPNNFSNAEHFSPLQDAELESAFLKYRPAILNALFADYKPFHGLKRGLFFSVCLSFLFHSSIFAAIILTQIPVLNSITETASIETEFSELDAALDVKQANLTVPKQYLSEVGQAMEAKIESTTTSVSAHPIQNSMETTDINYNLPANQRLPIAKIQETKTKSIKTVKNNNFKTADKPQRKSVKTTKLHQSIGKNSVIPSKNQSETKAASSEISQSAYTSLILAQINERKIYPSSAREQGLSGVVSIVFTIGKTGRVNQANIVKSSGQAILDAAAKQTLLSLSLPAPPGGYFNSQVPIRYSLTR